ncbi:MAG: hypothetical protein J6Z43_03795 [Clostridiales bacterium]|nr:hypothetical protein [Clostridiales bacterium]
MKRPDFDSIKTYEEFKRYKWYQNELSNICKAHGLLYNGTEKKLNKVIEAYFNGVRIPPRRDWYTNKLLMGFVNDNGVLMTFDLGLMTVSLILVTIGLINKVNGADEVKHVLPFVFGLTGLIVAVLFTYWGQDLDVIRSYIPTCGDRKFTRAQIDAQANSDKTVPLRYGDILLAPDMLIGVSAGVVAVAYEDISSLWVKKTWHTSKGKDYHIYKIIVRTKKGKRIVISKCERDADDAVETIQKRCLKYNPQVKILKTRYSLLADEDTPKQITSGNGVKNSVANAEEQQFLTPLTVDGDLRKSFIWFHRRAAILFIPESIRGAALAVGIFYVLATFAGIAFPILIFVLLPFYSVYNLFNTLYWIHKDDVEFYSAEIGGKDKKGYIIKGVSYYRFGYIRKLKPDKEPQIGDRVILARFKDDFSLISDNRE